MRDLTKRQKELLKKWYYGNEPSERARAVLGLTNPIRSVEDLKIEQWEELERINDTEVLYQNVNCFLMDLRMERF